MKDGGSAFPFKEPSSEWEAKSCQGMTLRDRFAGQALVGLFANGSYGLSDLNGGRPAQDQQEYARMAYIAADAMLAQREKS